MGMVMAIAVGDDTTVPEGGVAEFA